MNKNDDYMNIGESVKNLKHIYKKTTYFKSYGTSIFLFIFITLIFFLFFSYYNVKNNIHKYQSNPSEYRCHPTVMPFAGYIYPHPGMTNSQFNRSNIMYCMRETLKDLLTDILQPLEYVSQQIQKIQTINFGSLNFLRTLFSDIRNAMSGIFGLLYNLLENFFASINHIIVFLSSAFIKTVTLPLSVIYASNIVIYCLRIIAKRLLTSIIAALTVLGIFTTGIFFFVFCAVFFPTLIIPIVGEALAPIFATAAAVGTASIFVVTYIIIAVIYGEIAHALSIGLQISYEEAPNPPKLIPPILRR
jgi:hypothetical protein